MRKTEPHRKYSKEAADHRAECAARWRALTRYRSQGSSRRVLQGMPDRANVAGIIVAAPIARTRAVMR